MRRHYSWRLSMLSSKGSHGMARDLEREKSPLLGLACQEVLIFSKQRPLMSSVRMYLSFLRARILSRLLIDFSRSCWLSFFFFLFSH
ncbi:mCG146862 [Mus musculus]|nr:mCG146862 [Mus musculus]